MPVLLVHIGDMHIRCVDDEVLTRVDSIVAAIRARRLSPSACLVVVPGDVVYSGRADEYAIAEGFFRELLARLEQEFPGVKAEIAFVPGNHDCDFTLASDIRKTGHIWPVLPGIDITGAFVREYLAVQDPFFNFTARFGQVQETSAARLVTRRTFISARRHTVGLTCYNTAWLSQNPELVGKLFYPPDLHVSPDELTADVEIAIIHHPYNWLEPTNSRAFRQALELRADIVMTGHEHHPDSYLTQRQSSSVQFIAGQALFDARASTNGFNVISIDLNQQQWVLETLVWNGTAYTPLTQGTEKRPFLRNTALTEQGFINNSRFLQDVTDIGTGFTHLRKDLRLNDLFVYPSLLHRPLQRKLEGVHVSPNRISAKDVPQFISSEPRLIILGADKSGKTALARSVYRLLQTESGLVPLLLNGGEIKSSDHLSATLDSAYIQQYSDATLDRFKQLPTSRKVIIIDDFGRSQISRKVLGRVIEDLERWFDKIILFADEHFELDHVVTANARPILIDYRQYYIEEFNRVLRSKLIKRWVTLGRTDYRDEVLDREVDDREKIIDTLLGKQLLPAFPIIIIAILQALEVSRNANTASGSYGELYEALITDRLASISKKPTDVGTKYTLIARLAYFMYTNEKDALEAGDIDSVCDSYLTEYGVRIVSKSLIGDLLFAEILYESSGSYKFKYPYYYHFFVARYFRDNLQDPLQAAALRSSLEHMADTVYYDTYVNILIFYLYFTKDIQIVERILANAEVIYKEVKPADLEDDAKFVNGLYLSPPKPVLLPGDDIEQNRDAARQQLDDVEDVIRLQGCGDRLQYSESLDDIIKINIALKTLHILGQVLRNFPGSLRRDVKIRIAEQSYLLGLRVLGLVLESVEKNTDELRRYYALLIRHRQPTLPKESLSQSAEEAIIALVEFWAYGMIKTISFAVGLEDLAETYKEVVKRYDKLLSVDLIDVSIKLDHFWVFPEAQVDSLHRRVRKNYVGFSVLRYLVANYLYLYRSSYAIKQKYGKLLDIDVKATRFAERGLNKAEEPD